MKVFFLCSLKQQQQQQQALHWYFNQQYGKENKTSEYIFHLLGAMILFN